MSEVLENKVRFHGYFYRTSPDEKGVGYEAILYRRGDENLTTVGNTTTEKSAVKLITSYVLDGLGNDFDNNVKYELSGYDQALIDGLLHSGWKVVDIPSSAVCKIHFWNRLKSLGSGLESPAEWLDISFHDAEALFDVRARELTVDEMVVLARELGVTFQYGFGQWIFDEGDSLIRASESIRAKVD